MHSQAEVGGDVHEDVGAVAVVTLNVGLQVPQHAHQARVVLRDAGRHSPPPVMGRLGEGPLEGQGHPRDGVDGEGRSGGTGGGSGCRQAAEQGAADSVTGKTSIQN